MSKLNKKILSVGLAVTTLIWLSGTTMMIPQAKAATNEELQAQIAALLASIQALQNQLNNQGGTTAPICSFTRDLTVGSKSDDVMCLQRWLNANNYKVATSGAGSPGMETTYFGNLTRMAVANFQIAKGIAPTAGYFGPKTRAAVVAMGGIVIPVPPGTPPPPPVGTGLNVTLASDNAPAMTIAKGATSIPFLKFNISGSGTVSSLTFKLVGLGSPNDFVSGGINLYDGTTRLTSGKSINSTTYEVTFPNLALSVSGIKTLTLVGNTTSSATAGNVDTFNLINVTGTPTPTGFPLMGNGMVIGGVTVGTVTADDATAPSNPNIGATEAPLLELRLTAGSVEDIEVSRITLTQGGTVQNSYLTNLKMKQADQVVATAGNIGANNLVTFNFATPFKIEKGQNKTFTIYGDILGAARSGDTIVFYVDSGADIMAKGLLYGYNVSPNVSDIDTTAESDTLTLQGANITMNFKGPVTNDIALRGQDVTLYEFNFTAKNNIEIKNFRFSATTTGLIAGEGFNDFKLWDSVSNTVLTSATDITTTTAVTFTDTINVSANQARTFKLTADVDADNDDGDTIQVLMLPFQSNDIRNLDNNTYVTPSTDITPNSIVIGNVQTVRVPTADIGLSASPSSKTYVQGTQNAALVGFSFRAVADNVKITQVKVYATSTTGTLTQAELTSLGLYDGATRLGDLESLDSSLTATFNNFNLVIPKNDIKILTVKANIATDATNADVYAVYINALADVTSYDTQGNSLTNTGLTANSGYAVKITIANVGDVTVQADPSDTVGIILAGQESILGNYKFNITNEDLLLKDLDVLIASSNTATATSTTTGDDIPYIRLYDGTTLLGGGADCQVNGVNYTHCFSVPISGASSGIVLVRNLNWTLPAGSPKILTVKGLVDTVRFNGEGADSGTTIWASIMAENFKASGQTTDDTAITAATGQQKVIFKSKPTLSMIPYNGSLQSGSAIPAFKFRIAADSAGQIEWRKIQFYVTMSGATMSAVTTGATGNTQLDDLTNGLSNLSLSTAYSGAGVGSSTTATITGNNAGYVTLELTTSQNIGIGAYRDYMLKLGFSDLITSPGATAGIRLFRGETVLMTGTWYAGLTGSTATSGIPSFIWSDVASSSHATSTGDWTNGGFDGMIKTFGEVNTIHN